MYKKSEINRKMAELVMGWMLVECPLTTERRLSYSYWTTKNKGPVGYYAHHDFEGRGEPCWNPAENITHAFEVVEKMREKHYDLYLYCHSAEGYEVDILIGDGNTIIANKTADTPSMAICRGALKCMKSKNEG